MTNNKLTGLGADHPANGPLITERLHQLRDAFLRNLQYSNGGSMDYIIADAVKAIDELLEVRAAEPDYIRYDCGCCGWETIEDWRDNDVCPKCNHKPMCKTELFTAPPAPVMPDKMSYQDGVLFVLNNDMSSIERGAVAMRAWNACRSATQDAQPVPEDVRQALSIMDDEIIAELDAEESACRAAMLQGSQPVSNRDELREQVRREHAEWSDATFGNVGPIGPLKHLSKEALEAADDVIDLSE